jgi:hypothetical protein
MFEDFLRAIDAAWGQTAPRIPLRIIGSAALFLQTQYRRGTKDGDVLETDEISQATRAQLIALAGENTTLHKRHRVYIDIVGNGIPFLPRRPNYHFVPALSTLVHFEVSVLDVVDVVVSKLKRFHANDQSDIQAMIDGEHVPHEKLIERFRTAVDWWTGDPRADQLPRYLKNLNRVERDFFGVAETSIELPDPD